MMCLLHSLLSRGSAGIPRSKFFDLRRKGFASFGSPSQFRFLVVESNFLCSALANSQNGMKYIILLKIENNSTPSSNATPLGTAMV